MKTLLKIGLLALAGAAASVAPSLAADMAEPPLYDEAPDMVPVEVGSGWYLRGDVSYDFASDFEGRQDGTFAGRFGNAADFGSFGGDYGSLRIEEGFGGSLGMGYQFTDVVRGDLTAGYWAHDLTADNDLSQFCGLSDGCGSADIGKMKAAEVMANAYLDLGTFAGVTPYVGGGAGAVHIQYDDVAATGTCRPGFDCSTFAMGPVTYDGAEDWRFAYALSAGLAYDVTRNVAVDVGYRYLNVAEGDMYSYAGDAFSQSYDEFGLSAKDGGFDRHTVQAGLRYRLW